MTKSKIRSGALEIAASAVTFNARIDGDSPTIEDGSWARATRSS